MSIRARAYDAAIEQSRAALEMDPDFPMGHNWLGVACALSGRHEEAIAALQVADRAAGSTMASLQVAWAYAVAGRTDEARQRLAAMHQVFEKSYAEPYGFALLYAALGEPDKAFEWLERCAQDRSGQFAAWVNGDPRLDSLRGDPRMREMLRRVGLAPAL